MRVLVDAALPASITHDAPSSITYVRWTQGDQPDDGLVRHAAEDGFQAVVFYGSHALLQPSVIGPAAELGIVLLAVDAKSPVDAKKYVIGSTNKIRHAVTKGSSSIINSQGVHPHPGSRV